MLLRVPACACWAEVKPQHGGQPPAPQGPQRSLPEEAGDWTGGNHTRFLNTKQKLQNPTRREPKEWLAARPGCILGPPGVLNENSRRNCVLSTSREVAGARGQVPGSSSRLRLLGPPTQVLNSLPRVSLAVPASSACSIQNHSHMCYYF